MPRREERPRAGWAKGDAFSKAVKSLRPFRGIVKDIQSRIPCYKTDWRDGFNCGIRILAPATYIFFASAIPALAFGQQISIATDGILTVVHILVATAMTGLLQTFIGGQPLLIVGVSEPITLIYGYCYSFGKNRSGIGPDLFLAWMAWVCVWAALMIFFLAIVNACEYTDRFTRLSGELFGMLIAVLFLQQAIKGTLSEFRVDKTPYSASSPQATEYQWRLCNGLWALFIGFGTVICALKVQSARSWRFYNRALRGFFADYGVTLSVFVWSGLSYALQGGPQGVPRRLALPNTWDVRSTWTVANEMGQVPGSYIAGALIPALLIAILFYFDHTVSAQMAQLDEFNLQKPSAYHYDLFLLGWMTLSCGLLGLPPVNGVLPQAPLHTKSLITLKEQNIRASIQRAVKKHGGSQEQLFDSMARECKLGGAPNAAGHISKTGIIDKSGGCQSDEGLTLDLPTLIECKVMPGIPLEAHEQRVSNLIQSLLVAACLAGPLASGWLQQPKNLLPSGITPGIRKMPTSVLWGYFAYLAIASLPGSQFWERFLLMFTETSRRPPKYPGTAEAPWFGHVKWRAMIAFTLFQAVYCGIVYGITWIPIAGVVFPVPILLLIPAREYLLPRFFGKNNLAELDPAPYESAEDLPSSVQRNHREADVSQGNSRPGNHLAEELEASQSQKGSGTLHVEIA